MPVSATGAQLKWGISLGIAANVVAPFSLAGNRGIGSFMEGISR